MMQIEMIEQTVDRQMADVGIGSDFEEPMVRLLLFHLCIAIDIYRHMTQAEKNKAGYWYRETLKNSFSITGFLKERKKERKRKRDKKSSPLHPSYKEESGVKEKAQSSLPPLSKKEIKESDEKEGFEERQQAFWAELEPYCRDRGGKYDRQMVLKFFYYWVQEVKKTGTMRWENETAWTTEFALAGWSKKPFETYAQAANIRLERTKGRKYAPQAVITQEEQAVAAKRAEDNEKLDREIAERKAGAVSYEEYMKMKDEK